MTSAVAALGFPTVEIVRGQDAASLATSIVGFGDVIACGGDGTVSLVVNAMDRRRQRLAILPAGRGNSVARDLGVGDLDSAAAALRRAKSRIIDIIHCTITRASGHEETCLAVNGIGVGVVARLVARARLSPELGAAGYVLAGLSFLPRPLEIALVLEENEQQLLWLSGILIANTRHFSRYIACKQASVDDGFVEVIHFPAGILAEKVLEISLLLRRGATGAAIRQVAKAEVRLTAPASLYLDGELLHDVGGFRAECLPAALTCIAGTFEL